MSARPRVLLVGAGSVGQVFGRFLAAAGCELTFLVKARHAEATRAGFTLHPLGLVSRGPPERLSGFEVLESQDEVARRTWDQVWFCVSSAALREGTWVGGLARATGEATWVMLQPALHDREWLLQHVPEDRLVSGLIPFISFASPLKPGQGPGPGTAFWLPPLARGLFSGPPGRLREVVRALRQGGYPAREHPSVAQAMAVPSAVLNVFVTGLEAADWRFARFREGPSVRAVREATREAIAIATGGHRGRTAWAVGLLRPLAFRLAFLGTRLAPFDMETYLRAHFTKVSAQTRLMIREYIDTGRDRGQPVRHLEALNAPGARTLPR
ncbi:2-dehydropantoate 2-reductase N-terminal domain-containing protein [Stigmatella erecta]|uniref:Ketopantoate reductase n=1 Tax=Stigmatella erecta TaxID=83460 RepID=A0A1I0EKI0_9BACT|nr:2-dehydropantoate 2-reductase N-terminal domain-containing protein [Stigmatella erecta]SET45692.1 ketopantoate reductase [Stigmatella erecta]